MKGMKHDSTTIAWGAMGDEWFEMAQTDESRNCFIMPNMLKFMGDVNGKKMLDLGCGEGVASEDSTVLVLETEKIMWAECVSLLLTALEKLAASKFS